MSVEAPQIIPNTTEEACQVGTGRLRRLGEVAAALSLVAVLGACSGGGEDSPADVPHPGIDTTQEEPAVHPNTLHFIKTHNTGSGRVEIHTATAESGYGDSDAHRLTYFGTAEGQNGRWQMVDETLYFLKERKTRSGHVELHTATADSGYQGGDVQAITPFTPAQSEQGILQLADINGDNQQDIVFIHTQGTASGKVEVDVSYGPHYRERDLHKLSGFDAKNAPNGTYQIHEGDLVFIQIANTHSGQVEYSRADGAEQDFAYPRAPILTRFRLAEASNGAFSLAHINNDQVSDLAFVKWQATGSGNVEVFAVDGTDPQALILAKPTLITQSQDPSGQEHIGTFQFGNGQ